MARRVWSRSCSVCGSTESACHTKGSQNVLYSQGGTEWAYLPMPCSTSTVPFYKLVLLGFQLRFFLNENSSTWKIFGNLLTKYIVGESYNQDNKETWLLIKLHLSWTIIASPHHHPLHSLAIYSLRFFMDQKEVVCVYMCSCVCVPVCEIWFGSWHRFFKC